MSDFDEIQKHLAIREETLRVTEEKIRAERAQLEQDKRVFAAAQQLRDSIHKQNKTENRTAAFWSDLVEVNHITPKSAAPAIVVNGKPAWPVPLGPDGKVPFKQAVQEGLKRVPGEFTSRDLIAELEGSGLGLNIEGNRSNLAGYLREFVEEGKIELIEEGSGRRPALYRKK